MVIVMEKVLGIMTELMVTNNSIFVLCLAFMADETVRDILNAHFLVT